MVRGTIFPTNGLALEALTGGRTVLDLAAAYEVDPTMIPPSKQARLAFSSAAARRLQPGSTRTRCAICLPRSAGWPLPWILGEPYAASPGPRSARRWHESANHRPGNHAALQRDGSERPCRTA